MPAEEEEEDDFYQREEALAAAAAAEAEEEEGPYGDGGGGKFSLEHLDDLPEYGDDAMFGGGGGGGGGGGHAEERQRRDARRRMRWSGDSGERMDETMTLLPLGQTCASLRGENELWLGVALSSPALAGLDAQQIAGVAGALCCDSNRPTSCDYGPSPALAAALQGLDPAAADVMALQFEAQMDSPVNLSRSVAALVEAWAAGASWDQVRRLLSFRTSVHRSCISPPHPRA